MSCAKHPHMVAPMTTFRPKSIMPLTEAIKKQVHVPVVAVGGFNDPEQITPCLRYSRFTSLASDPGQCPIPPCGTVPSIPGASGSCAGATPPRLGPAARRLVVGGGTIGWESGYFFASEWGAKVDIL